MTQTGKYCAAFLAVCLFISPLMAQNPRNSFHLNGGYSWMLQENIDSGFKTGFGFSVPLLKNTALTFDFEFWKSNVQEETGSLYDGKLTMAPFRASLYCVLLETKRFAPYVFGGTGFVFSNFEMDDFITIPEITVDQEINNGISFHAGAGSFLKLNKNIALYGEAYFFYRKGEGTTTITYLNMGESTETFSLNLNSLVFSIGIKYYL